MEILLSPPMRDTFITYLIVVGVIFVVMIIAFAVIIHLLRKHL